MSFIDREARRGLIREMLGREGEPTRIMLSGMVTSREVEAVNEALPDIAGFVTSVSDSLRSLTSGDMGRLASLVDERVCTASITVDLPFARVGYNARRFVDLVVLRGYEDDSYVQGVRMRTNAGIIQGIRLRHSEDVERANRSVADMLLLDAERDSAELVDFALLEAVRRPFILSGALTPDNVAQVVRELRPWGVELSHGVETQGEMDPLKMKAAVAAVRGAC